jgi:dTMP kinase
MTFIVLEGGEGSGKSTQARRLASWLRKEGREVVLTFEPGDTPAGAQVRDVLLHGDAPIDPRAELLLMLADRAQHVAEVIRPALERGATVVSDRYSPSTLAYQGVARELGVAEVEAQNRAATAGLEADIVVVLDLPDEDAESRLAPQRDRVERAGDDFHRLVRAAYRDLAASHGWTLVDGSGSIDEVAVRVRDAVTPFVS